jgi:hypothetical protein
VSVAVIVPANAIQWPEGVVHDTVSVTRAKSQSQVEIKGNGLVTVVKPVVIGCGRINVVARAGTVIGILRGAIRAQLTAVLEIILRSTHGADQTILRARVGTESSLEVGANETLSAVGLPSASVRSAAHHRVRSLVANDDTKANGGRDVTGTSAVNCFKTSQN